jgi:hypothetical protein
MTFDYNWNNSKYILSFHEIRVWNKVIINKGKADAIIIQILF